ncbi:hypothetical protein L208DRAFT_1379635 [Tricholoma matsutake]|nr:hypothetical protein L208DRAFT_1379635 [Tricholoma matsutake 945]
MALPSIHSWFHDSADSHSSNDETDEDEPGEDSNWIPMLKKDDEVMMNLTCTAMAITADEMMKVLTKMFHISHALNDVDDETTEEILYEEYLAIREALDTHVIPPIHSLEDDPAKPLGKGMIGIENLDHNVLVQLR